MGEPHRPRVSKQGAWEGKGYSPDEVDKAAEIYMSNRDLTPWEVWTRYERNRGEEGALGRRKVKDLIDALDNGPARWDSRREHVEGLERSLSEPERVLIPRRKSAL